MNFGVPDLHISQFARGRVTKIGENYWRLEIPPRTKRGYCLAQLDDHGKLSRRDFRWRPPLTLSLQARLSADNLPGTWGFGLWNDPFGFLLGSDGQLIRFPTLPDTLWFFHASPENYLSFRDDLPASGFLAATFSSRKVPALLLVPASPILVLSLLPGTAQLVRRLLRYMISQDASLIHTDVTAWHAYRLEWQPDRVILYLDSNVVLQTEVVPNSTMSLVIWIDNQYAALPPRGRLRYGTLPHPVPVWMEVRDIELA